MEWGEAKAKNQKCQKLAKSQDTEFLSINLIKYVKDLNEKNYNTLIKEIKEKLNNWGDILFP